MRDRMRMLRPSGPSSPLQIARRQLPTVTDVGAHPAERVAGMRPVNCILIWWRALGKLLQVWRVQLSDRIIYCHILLVSPIMYWDSM